MDWKNFNPSLATHDLIQDSEMVSAAARRSSRQKSPRCSTAIRCARTSGMRSDRNFLALYDMGLHPYLGGQFARLIFGNEAGKSGNGRRQQARRILAGQGIGCLSAAGAKFDAVAIARPTSHRTDCVAGCQRSPPKDRPLAPARALCLRIFR